MRRQLWSLTRNGSALHEGSVDIRVHLYHDVTLLSNASVSLLDLPHDPQGKGIAQDAIGHVGNPLFR